jgi:hypothetical protein
MGRNPGVEQVLGGGNAKAEDDVGGNDGSMGLEVLAVHNLQFVGFEGAKLHIFYV